MQSADSAGAREAEITKLAHSATDRTAVEEHLKEIIEGPDFRGSHRSGQFLRFIVEKALAGQFTSLKERVIAVELFGRDPSYDTGDDAIVRVTASDVRKRLLRHYEKQDSTSSFRIFLPPGSYLPEITRLEQPEEQPAALPADDVIPAAARDTAIPNPENSLLPAPPAARVEAVVIPPRNSSAAASLHWRSAAFGALLASVLLVSAYFLSRHVVSQNGNLQAQLPWSAFLSSPHTLHLITSDPNISEIRGLIGAPISISDYANHLYIPEDPKISPELLNVCRIILRGDKCPNIDATIAAGFAEQLGAYHKHIDVRGARNIQLADLRNDDDFIILGSPRTDPWSSLFSDQLDFRFAEGPQHEYIQNVHPRANEAAQYVSTAPGWATGQTFALIAFVQNPDQKGQVLLVAGASGEGTAAAGEFLHDYNRFANATRRCGISESGSVRHFELLLRLNMLAGAPNHIEMIACHILQNSSVSQ